MKITSIKPQTFFKGYDARPLKGFIMGTSIGGIKSEMRRILSDAGRKTNEQYDVFCLEEQGVCQQDIDFFSKVPWVQDFATLKNGQLYTLFFDDALECIKSGLGVKENEMQKAKKMQNPFAFNKIHIKGGNMFIVKNPQGNDDIFVGENEFENFSQDEIKKMYNVDNVIKIPQADFHLDLFMRPLDNHRVLLADDNMAQNVLVSILSDLVGYMRKPDFTNRAQEEQLQCYMALKSLDKAIQLFNTGRTFNAYKSTSEVEKVLNDNGYEVIKTPSRVYCAEECPKGEKQLFVYLANFMNANAFQNKNGDIILMTNHCLLDDFLNTPPQIKKEIKGSLESRFVDSIKQYVKEENIYFIKGKNNAIADNMLAQNQGGIHCFCAEIPKE